MGEKWVVVRGNRAPVIEQVEARLLLSAIAPLRIDAGGPAYTDANSNAWHADEYSSGGSVTNIPYSVNQTGDDPLYYSRRWGNFSYNIPVSPGSYTVNLYFSESRDTHAGQRLFDVSAEGTTLLDRFDAFAAAGYQTAVSESFTLNVSDGMLNVKFASIKDVAMVSAIEVIANAATAAPLPSPWIDADIGSPAYGGSASVDGNGVFTVSGGGWDIYGSNDSFNFVYQPMVGDGTIVAKIPSVGNTNEWAKAGLMIRENLSTSSRMAMIMLTPKHGASFEWRGGTLSMPGWIATPSSYGSWVELVRTGGTISGYLSSDGVNWKGFGSATLPFANNVYVGLAVTAHDNSKLNTSTFSNVSVTPATADSSIWTAGANTPMNRFESATFTWDDKVFVFGGFYNNSTDATKECDEYDPATDTWTRLGDMPALLTHVGVAVVGDTVYFAGGYIGNWPHVTLSSVVYTYDPATDTWANFATLPAARAAGGLVAVGDVLHYFGGVSSTSITDSGTHWSLDLDDPDATWQTLPSMPDPRNHIGYAAVDGLIYAIGGLHGDNETSGNDSEVDVYDPDTNKWSKAASLPVARSHFHNSTFVVDGKIVIIGGETNGKSDSVSLGDITEYDPLTNNWSLIATLPEARQAPTAVLTDDGNLVVVGGAIGPNGGGGYPQSQTWITDQIMFD